MNNIFIVSFGISHHASQSCSLSVFPYPPLNLAASLKKNHHHPPNKAIKNRTKQKKINSLFHLSNTSSFILVSLGAAVCHTACPIVQPGQSTTCSLQRVTGPVGELWHTMVTGPSAKLFQLSSCCPKSWESYG